MRPFSFIIGLIGIAAMWCSGVCAEKITADPNAAPRVETPNAEPLWKTDKRLDQKIEYDAGGARLHDVIADLAKTSGVNITAGKDDNDWRVRDLLVTVASRGTELRDLLQYITRSTHTILRAKKTDSGIDYMILSDPAVKIALDKFEQDQKNHIKERLIWNLKIAKQLKDIPQLTPPKDASSSWWDEAACSVEASKLLSAMDKETEKALLDGEALIFTPATAPAGMREAIIGFIKVSDKARVDINSRACEAVRKRNAEQGTAFVMHEIEPASSADIENSRVRIKVANNDVIIYGGVLPEGSLEACRLFNKSAHNMASLVMSDRNRGQEVWKTMPPHPQPPKLETNLGDAKPVTDPMPDIIETVCIKQGEEKKRLAFCNALIALSKQTGRTIVCEDFRSHQLVFDYADRLNAEMPLSKVLKRQLILDSYVDTLTKAIFAHENGWYLKHRTLIPERVIDNIITKSNGDGADLDDLAVLADYPSTNAGEWITGGKGGPAFWGTFDWPENKLLWQFYNSLSAKEKARVKAKDGLLVGQRDISLLVQWLKDRNDYNTATLFTKDDQQPAEERLLSPQARPTLTLRLETQEVYQSSLSSPEQPTVPVDKDEDSVPVVIPESFTKRHNYILYVEAMDGAEKISVMVRSGNDLPFFSAERTKMLKEALRKQEAKKAELVE